jgi:pimeloyl-ACP methyl ester carboxylesterase
MSGRAPVPVFLGGTLLGPEIWRSQLPRFEGAESLEMLDAPDPASATEWLAGHLRALPRPRALVCHGLAAAPALAIAEADPFALDGLVLVCVGAHVLAPAMAPGESAARAIERECVDGLPDELAEETRRALAGRPDDALRRDLAAWTAFESAGRLAHAPAATLVVAGGRDALVPVPAAEELAHELPSAGLAVLPNAGHAAPLEAAAALDLLVAAFLARLELLLAGR